MTKPIKVTLIVLGSLVLLLFILVLIGSIIESDSKIDTESVLNWDTVSYERKKQWLEEYVQSSDNSTIDLAIMAQEGIKNKFRYPREVEFDFGSHPSLSNAVIGDADSAWVFINGTGTAKNEYGVRQSFKYLVKFTIKPAHKTLDNVSVTLPE
jgi:hypothetical protein